MSARLVCCIGAVVVCVSMVIRFFTALDDLNTQSNSSTESEQLHERLLNWDSKEAEEFERSLGRGK